MNILLVISQYKPAINPNIIRWSTIVDYWLKCGHDVTILTTKKRGEPKIEKGPHLTIYRTGYNTLYDFIKTWRRQSRHRDIPHRTPDADGLGSWFNQKLADIFWRSLYWPDGSVLFLGPGKKMITDICREQNIECMYTVGLPFTCHLIGRHARDRMPNLRWHMDIEDPFCYSKEFRVNNRMLYKKRNIREERRCFERADAISVTNVRAGEKYNDLFPEHAEKIRVIPPLFAQYKKSDATFEKDPSRVHLGYFGSFYTNVRTPDMFLAFVEFMRVHHREDLELLHFHFTGAIDDKTMRVFKRYKVPGQYFSFHGLVTRDETLAMMKQMDVLINFGNATDYHLPSKVVDYMYVSKPIVNVIRRSDDTFAQFLHGRVPTLNLLLNTDHFDQQKHAFLNFIHKANSMESPPGDVSPYTTEVIAAQYACDQ